MAATILTAISGICAAGAEATPHPSSAADVDTYYSIKAGDGLGHATPRRRLERRKLRALRRCIERAAPGSTVPIRRVTVMESYNGNERNVRRWILGADEPTMESNETHDGVPLVSEEYLRHQRCITRAMDPRATAPVDPESPDADTATRVRWTVEMYRLQDLEAALR